MSPGGLITPLAIAALAAGAAALWCLDGLRARFAETLQQVGNEGTDLDHGHCIITEGQRDHG